MMLLSVLVACGERLGGVEGFRVDPDSTAIIQCRDELGGAHALLLVWSANYAADCYCAFEDLEDPEDDGIDCAGYASFMADIPEQCNEDFDLIAPAGDSLLGVFSFEGSLVGSTIETVRTRDCSKCNESGVEIGEEGELFGLVEVTEVTAGVATVDFDLDGIQGTLEVPTCGP